MNWDESFAERIAVGDVHVGGGVSDEKISNAEAVVGRFPEEYRIFLSRFGYATFAGNAVFGLGENIPKYLDVVEMTLVEREDSPGLPVGAIVIYNDGGGNLTFLISSQERREESRVFTLYHDDPDESEEAAEGFGVWLTDKLE